MSTQVTTPLQQVFKELIEEARTDRFAVAHPNTWPKVLEALQANLDKPIQHRFSEEFLASCESSSDVDLAMAMKKPFNDFSITSPLKETRDKLGIKDADSQSDFTVVVIQNAMLKDQPGVNSFVERREDHVTLYLTQKTASDFLSAKDPKDREAAEHEVNHVYFHTQRNLTVDGEYQLGKLFNEVAASPKTGTTWNATSSQIARLFDVGSIISGARINAAIANAAGVTVDNADFYSTLRQDISASGVLLLSIAQPSDYGPIPADLWPFDDTEQYMGDLLIELTLDERAQLHNDHAFAKQLKSGTQDIIGTTDHPISLTNYVDPKLGKIEVLDTPYYRAYPDLVNEANFKLASVLEL